jgi:hypothetical protein
MVVNVAWHHHSEIGCSDRGDCQIETP